MISNRYPWHYYFMYDRKYLKAVGCQGKLPCNRRTTVLILLYEQAGFRFDSAKRRWVKKQFHPGRKEATMQNRTSKRFGYHIRDSAKKYRDI